ncbi:rhodanese-like domain-containing protein [Kyrpidia spormannii]|uniref:Rhodanese-like domain-containing protein n=2 Tax=Kyrpidia spormannii TaxID=2055160 RepID=A0A2K8N3L7_9BACL|nr:MULTISPECIES: rhodanese-like domain-containing protein [Kyrpidia]HHY66402.1 rhodanese-like domain-containing protein [Alicyclobacillus sp.]ATY84063.1 rhodanese-like domain-containing protein [Kyrpidia spormannii]MCL6575096.1 rhodanese-like domain-containing protein [Kyrpidia sp.]CAB3390175.1 Rhodanese-like domain-containing protein [Kyrpidia spormannii]CAB3391097.1 Rhodanese-like domain-containing protein [Kyrpidia spormannii]
MREWSGEDLWRRMQEGTAPRIIDVREPVEYYEHGHIPGAELIPMGEIPAALGRISKHEEIVFVCRSGSRSGHVCQFLQRLGYERVINLAGGMIYWPGAVNYGPESEGA